MKKILILGLTLFLSTGLMANFIKTENKIIQDYDLEYSVEDMALLPLQIVPVEFVTKVLLTDKGQFPKPILLESKDCSYFGSAILNVRTNRTMISILEAKCDNGEDRIFINNINGWVVDTNGTLGVNLTQKDNIFSIEANKAKIFINSGSIFKKVKIY